ncbi:MAG: DUF378 domain-containing protein [Planctomycetota bacterium]|jgi:uncharacterized membrane protein YuzA (DUF378 family)
MLKLNRLGWVALVLLIIGSLNWGLMGIFNGFDIVAAIFGEMSVFSRIVYVLVGLSALYILGETFASSKFAKHTRRREQPA